MFPCWPVDDDSITKLQRFAQTTKQCDKTIDTLKINVNSMNSQRSRLRREILQI